MGRPTLSPEHAQRILDALARLRDQRFAGNASELARHLRVSQAAVSALFRGIHKPSMATAERVAKLLHIPVWELLEEAPVAATLISHPNLAAALDVLGSRVTVEARERVCRAAAHLPDIAQTTWIAMLMDSAHQEGAATPSAPPPPTTRTQTVPVTKKSEVVRGGWGDLKKKT